MPTRIGNLDSYKITIQSARNLPLPTNTEYLKHTVKKDETVPAIAEQYGVDPVQLAEFLRSEEGTDMLFEGQEIPIPTEIVEV